METYRSGHNGADSKSVCRQRHVGSNPTVSAKRSGKLKGLLDFSFFVYGAVRVIQEASEKSMSNNSSSSVRPFHLQTQSRRNISSGAVKIIAPFLSAWIYEIFPSFLYKSATILDFKSKMCYIKIV